MTWRTQVRETPTSAREHRVWRLLVGGQLTVIALILLALLVIYLMGALGALFSQHSL